MDHMNMGDSSTSTGSMTMAMSLHFTPGDTVLFAGWIPTKPGPIFGACVALFLLAILERWLAALRRFMELYWAESVRLMLSKRVINLDDKTPSLEKGKDVSQISVLPGGSTSQQLAASSYRLSMRNIPPWIATHDLARGLFTLFQSALTYTLMLIVMTFNAGFILSVLIGLATGEVLFGRLAFAASTH